MTGDLLTGISNLSLQLGKKVIFSGRSITVDKGEKVCLSGPSGVGKTTFLNLLMGFELPDTGRVLVLGQELKADNVRSLRGLISWVPQEVSIDAGTGRDLLLGPLRFRANRALIPEEARLFQLMDALLLEHELLEQRTDTLSGGQKQRLVIGSAILMNKPLLLLDEPTSALDDASVMSLSGVLKGMEDITIISVSHDERWYRGMDRVIPLENNPKDNGKHA